MAGLHTEGYENIAREVINSFENRFKDNVEDFTVLRGFDSPYTEFTMNFKLYNYYILKFTYDRGLFGCSICYGSVSVPIDNSQKWYDKADLDIFCAELDEQIRLRIPDKYLAHYGWL
jgi:hypothetical protein